MTAIECRVCDANTDATLCKPCTNELARAVGDMRSLMHELSIVATRQARVYRANSRPESEREQFAAWNDEQRRIPAWLRSREGRSALKSTQLMVNLDARELLWVAGNTLSAWTKHLAERRRAPLPTSDGMLPWLLSNLDRARFDVDAAELHDEITELHRQLVRAVDRSPSRIYAGPCHAPLPDQRRCQRPIFAIPGAAELVCDGWHPDHPVGIDVGCRAKHTRDERRDWLLDELEDALLPLDLLRRELPRLFPSLVMPAESTWRSWLSRGRLGARTVIDGQELFRGGDVIDLVLDQAARPGPKRQGRGRICA